VVEHADDLGRRQVLRDGGEVDDVGEQDRRRAELPREVATQRQETEITWILAALGALLAAGALAASIRWSPQP
jgi:hypothetical protein